MNNENLISVVVTTYNQEDYIENCLRSVLEQECSARIEILVGDDCSTDNTKLIIQKLATEFPNIIKPVYNENNVGLSQNLYNQIVRSRGGVIAYLDGDDWWCDKYKLQKQYQFLKDNPEYNLIISFAKAYNNELKTFGKRLGNPSLCEFENMMFADEDVQSQTMLFKKDLLLQHISDFQWYVKNNCFFDSIIAYYYALYGKIHFIEEELAVYRILSNSGCHSTDSQKQIEHLKRYFAIKSRFLVENKVSVDIVHEVLLREWDNAFTYGMNIKESQIRTSKRYKLGAFIIDILKKIKFF